MTKFRSWYIATLSAVLLGGSIYLASNLIIGLWGSDCDPVQQTNSIPSPDGKLNALLWHQACAGGFGSGSETYWVKVRQRDAPSADTGLTVFEAQQYPPDLSWSNPRRLTITLTKISQVGASLHKAYDAD